MRCVAAACIRKPCKCDCIKGVVCSDCVRMSPCLDVKYLDSFQERSLSCITKKCYGLNCVAVVLAYRIQTMGVIPMNPMSISTTCLRVSRSMMYRIVKYGKCKNKLRLGQSAGSPAHTQNICRKYHQLLRNYPCIFGGLLSQVWQHRGLSCSLAPRKDHVVCLPIYSSGK